MSPSLVTYDRSISLAAERRVAAAGAESLDNAAENAVAADLLLNISVAGAAAATTTTTAGNLGGSSGQDSQGGGKDHGELHVGWLDGSWG